MPSINFLSIPAQVFNGGCVLFCLYMLARENSFIVAAVLGVFFYVLIWTIQLLFNTVYIYFGKNRSLFTEHILEIQDQALYVETKFSKSHSYWLGIVKIVHHFGFVAIYTNANAAYVIPSRAFPSSEQQQLFVASVRSKIDNA